MNFSSMKNMLLLIFVPVFFFFALCTCNFLNFTRRLYRQSTPLSADMADGAAMSACYVVLKNIFLGTVNYAFC